MRVALCTDDELRRVLRAVIAIIAKFIINIAPPILAIVHSTYNIQL
jgi:hypothetical protein